MTANEEQSAASRAAVVMTRRIRCLGICLAASVTSLFFDSPAAHADVVEFLSGAKSQGTIVSKTEQYVTIKIVLGRRTLTRKYPTNRIHSVTIDGKREVINAKPGSSTTTKPGESTSPSRKVPRKPTNQTTRSRGEVLALIDKVGKTPPDWYDSAPLNYPQTLDLSWPTPPPKPWNSRKNVGQYIWDRINPNPGKWREGVRFLHHVLSVNEDRRDVVSRAMNSLGAMYYHLHEDYARAAFWWQQVGVDRQPSAYPHSGIYLAYCYWRLGSRQMTLDLLDRMPRKPYQIIKLLGDMGETDTALRYAEAFGRSGFPTLAYLYAGDVCRVADRLREAERYYRKVLSVRPAGQRKERIENDHKRAAANIAAIKFYTLDVGRVRDGTYRADSLGYAGQVHVEVAVKDGRLNSVRITRHKEKQYYSSLKDTPRKIIDRQGVTGIDATSGATITSEAIINATAKALAEGLK